MDLAKSLAHPRAARACCRARRAYVAESLVNSAACSFLGTMLRLAFSEGAWGRRDGCWEGGWLGGWLCSLQGNRKWLGPAVRSLGSGPQHVICPDSLSPEELFLRHFFHVVLDQLASAVEKPWLGAPDSRRRPFLAL